MGATTEGSRGPNFEDVVVEPLVGVASVETKYSSVNC